MKNVLFFALMLAVLAAGCVGETTPPEPTEAKRIFITSKITTGGLGGLEGADAFCQSAASEAGLGGTWVAWLSSSTVNAIDRIEDVGPWYLVDGKTLIFKDKNSMISSNPEAPISLDEYGKPIGDGKYDVYYWTGTGADGKKSGSPQYCLLGDKDWDNGTSLTGVNVGISRATTGSWWTAYPATYGCNNWYNLLCIEQ